jgi:hypothetical protein
MTQEQPIPAADGMQPVSLIYRNLPPDQTFCVTLQA